jgi:hypothetical protein
MTSRAIVLLLSLIVLLFEADLLAHRRASRTAVKKAFAVVALPLLVAFALVVVRRWRSFQ